MMHHHFYTSPNKKIKIACKYSGGDCVRFRNEPFLHIKRSECTTDQLEANITFSICNENEDYKLRVNADRTKIVYNTIEIFNDTEYHTFLSEPIEPNECVNTTITRIFNTCKKKRGMSVLMHANFLGANGQVLSTKSPKFGYCYHYL